LPQGARWPHLAPRATGAKTARDSQSGRSAWRGTPDATAWRTTRAEEQLMHRYQQIAIGLSLCGALGLSREARAQEESESAAMSANQGLKLGLGPMLLFPNREGGPFGGGLDVDGRYGIKAGPTVIAPGGLLGGYLISSRFIGVAMPTLRVTVPLGPFAPYLVGGVGGGWISNPSEGGVALLGGGGLMIHFGRIIAIGAELTYRAITGTEYNGFVLGPAISFGG
jgi:hypothetical protein